MKKILLNEKEYNMAFNFKVMKNICKELGLTMPQVMNGVQAMDLEIIGEILYQGIKVRHEDFEREVIDELSIMELFSAFENLGQLLTESMPTDNKKKVAKKK
ncbi:hypothetical protein [Clostridium perfringens]|uniref:hypothetical protein n=1 Tax=Clostridium perfringens TaxID=1502 RepID=UPI00115D9D02|nr:hypothetical protein [Clostridium perfringens]MCI6458229.1 hypothetical protein [Clostridium sp.]MDM0852581.1 hypothetical protein [Clostridium perfringens]